MNKEPILILFLLLFLDVPAYVGSDEKLQEITQEVKTNDIFCEYDYMFRQELYINCSSRGILQLPKGANNVKFLKNAHLLDNKRDNNNPKYWYRRSDVMNDNILKKQEWPDFIKKWKELRQENETNDDFLSLDSFKILIITLNLTKNRIETIEYNAFREMEFTVLDLSHNKLTTLPSNLFIQNKYLLKLKLQKNDFKNIPELTSKTLKSLDLRYCQIKSFKQDIFLNLTALLNVYLGFNPINEIPDNITSPTLEGFYISNTNIKTITNNTFSSLPKLSRIDLSSNNFSEIWPTHYFASNPLLTDVRIYYIKWNCEYNQNLIDTFDFFIAAPQKVKYLKSMICYYPRHHRGKLWIDVYADYQKEEIADRNKIIAFFSAIIIAMLIIVAFVLYTYFTECYTALKNFVCRQYKRCKNCIKCGECLENDDEYFEEHIEMEKRSEARRAASVVEEEDLSNLVEIVDDSIIQGTDRQNRTSVPRVAITESNADEFDDRIVIVHNPPRNIVMSDEDIASPRMAITESNAGEFNDRNVIVHNPPRNIVMSDEDITPPTHNDELTVMSPLQSLPGSIRERFSVVRSLSTGDVIYTTTATTTTVSTTTTNISTTIEHDTKNK